MCHAPADTRVPVSAWVHVPVHVRYSNQLLTIFFFCCCVCQLIARVPIYIRSHYGQQNTVFSEHFDIGDFVSFPTYFSDFFSHTRSLFGDCSVPDLFPGKFTKKFWYIPSVRFLDRTFFHPSWLSDVIFLAPKNTGIRSALCKPYDNFRTVNGKFKLFSLASSIELWCKGQGIQNDLMT